MVMLSTVATCENARVVIVVLIEATNGTRATSSPVTRANTAASKAASALLTLDKVGERVARTSAVRRATRVLSVVIMS